MQLGTRQSAALTAAKVLMMTTLLNNRYQIIQLLGVGGFGETFLAEDTYLPSRRRCVIKQLKPVTHDPQMYELIQQRFQREAATLESLGEGSYQIPNLYAYFSENGQFYLVQEWIQGQTLTSKVAAEGPLSETAVRQFLVDLLPVLDYVHSKGIIYRDIKPDNIIFRPSNNQPVLIDFGAVKETMTTAVNAQGKITHSIVLGTPGFMSPEQGAGRPVFASDIYSLGLTAIYLLTGKLPQELEIDPQTEQMFWQQHALNVSPSLATVLNKAIQYHPRDRYTTARKMLEDLQSSTSIPLLPQPATQATLAMSPVRGNTSSKTATVTARQIDPVINYSSNRGNWQKTLIVGSLLAGGLLGGAVVAGLVRNQLPQSTSEQPIVSSTPAPKFPQPPSEPTNVPVAPVTSQAPKSTEVAPLPPETQPQTTQDEEAVPPPQPETQLQITADQEAVAPSHPETELQATQTPLPPADSTPPQENEQPDDSASNAARGSIPGFPTGTSESQVRAALGNPTKSSRGVWGNTQALMYEVQPNQITLGYLFDRNSGHLRQTEVAFAQSVEPKVMQTTLQGMVGDRKLINVSQGLQQVYQRRTNRYTFNVGDLKGVIERNDRDRIYIGVWDADLH